MSTPTGLDAFCEMFRAWNRLEPRTRQVDFDEALECRIQDPLWMLTRQWQFGEFKGEDTGSAIHARIQMQTTRITKYQMPGGDVRPYQDDVPLEAVVESETDRISYKFRLQAAGQLLKYMDHYGGQFNAGSPAHPYDKAAYKSILIQEFPIQLPEVQAETDSDLLLVEKAALLSNPRARQLLSAMSGRSFDGIAFHRFLNAQPLATSLDLFLDRTDRSHRGWLEAAVDQFAQWCGKQVQLPAQKQTSAWDARQLEYQFNCALPGEGGQNTVLAAEAYYSGTLDWYSFELKSAAASPRQLLENEEGDPPSPIQTNTFSFIPTPAEYAGMPNPRWWEFEDGAVDLGNLNANTTDVAKIILSEFALVYGNDWFVVPYPVATGTLSTIKGIVVTDVFGQKTLVEAANQGQQDDWTGWGLFNLSHQKSDPQQRLPADSRLFLPPVLPRVQESAPVEDVYLVRDEMANMVWAIETDIHDYLEKATDGHAAAIGLTDFLAGFDTPAGNGTPPPTAPLIYQLGNTVPENWIPFIPIHLRNQNRKIQLQRAAMPRLFRGRFEAVRPRTQLMRSGFRPDPDAEVVPLVNPTAQMQQDPYYVFEEEVPRAGIRISAQYQRARWYGGRIFNWLGYRKTIGRGEGASGLEYDRILANKEAQSLEE
jgi:hypothetical protein